MSGYEIIESIKDPAVVSGMGTVASAVVYKISNLLGVAKNGVSMDNNPLDSGDAYKFNNSKLDGQEVFGDSIDTMKGSKSTTIIPQGGSFDFSNVVGGDTVLVEGGVDPTIPEDFVRLYLPDGSINILRTPPGGLGGSHEELDLYADRVGTYTAHYDYNGEHYNVHINLDRKPIVPDTINVGDESYICEIENPDLWEGFAWYERGDDGELTYIGTGSSRTFDEGDEGNYTLYSAAAEYFGKLGLNSDQKEEFFSKLESVSSEIEMNTLLKENFDSKSTVNVFTDFVVVNEPTIDVENIDVSKLSVYPSPADESIKINMDGNYTIYDIAGNLCLSGAQQKAGEHIDVSNLAAGVYIINVKNTETGQEETKKIVIQ